MENRKSKSRFQDIYLLHGKGGSPDGTVAKLEKILRDGYPNVKMSRPLLPHHDILVPAENSLAWLDERFLPFIIPGALLVGVSMGGLLAAKLQELHPQANFSVFAVVAPTSLDKVHLEKKMPNRVALYSSSADEVIRGRCENWPELTDQAFDVPWLAHDVDIAKYRVAFLLSCYLKGLDMQQEINDLFPSIFEDSTDETYG
jgi:pimeloyl-ACP methyl ester carboxylesterase